MSENGCCKAKPSLKEVINAHYGIAASQRPSHVDFADGLRYCMNDTFVTEDLLRKQFMEEKEMGIRETITLIGSMSETNKAAMMTLYNRLTWKGAIVHLPYMEKVTEDASDEQIKTLHKLHEYKMSDANLIIVVDADSHIGKDTQREIDWCVDNSKNLIYLSDMQVYDGEMKQTKSGKKASIHD